MICINVKPKLICNGSDSFTTGRSSVLYVSNKSCKRRFSLYPAKQTVNKNKVKNSLYENVIASHGARPIPSCYQSHFEMPNITNMSHANGRLNLCSANRFRKFISVFDS